MMPKTTPSNKASNRGPAVAAPQTREQWLDVAKGVSILSVVLFHAGAVASPESPAGRVWTLIDLGLFTFIMPLFFLVSGLFMGKSLTLPAKSFMRVKVWPTAYLFLLWSVIFALTYLATGGLLGDPLERSLTLQTIPWYLAGLAIHMIVARLLMPISVTAQLVSAAVLATAFGIWLPFNGWGLAHTPHFFVFFLIGCRAQNGIAALVNAARWKHITMILGTGLMLAAIAKLIPGTAPVAYAQAPLVVVPLVLIASKWIAKSDSLTRPLAALGRNTLPIFLLHPLLLQAQALTLNSIDYGGGLVLWVLPPLVTAVAVAGSLIFWTLLRRVPGLFQFPAARAQLNSR
jgi:uncharacterized membrane protein YcfT